MSRRLIAPVLVGVSLVGCGAAERVRPTGAGGRGPAAWTARKHVRGVVDLSSPGRRRAIVVAAAGRVELLLANGTLRPLARAYSAPRGLEPYIARSAGQEVAGAGCRFPADEIYALRLTDGTGVTVIDSQGRVRRFAKLPRRGLENGIAFDTTGRFAHRLLVTAGASGKTTVFAIDCRGRVDVIAAAAPKVEGGIVVAPKAFGRFAGDLIAPDEVAGRLYAIEADGRAILIAASGIPHGQDIGVESEGFVPARFREALVADRLTRGNAHPGDDVILGIGRAALTAAGVRAGDLLVVSEGGATTVAVTCRRSCRVRAVASGPARAHVEGHVVFSAGGP